MSAPSTIRLHLLVARAAPRILIIRRGPSRVYHLALWHTDTDTVEHGSWFRGQLYVYRCDLSWDGQWLVYFAMGPTRQYYSWTAVSRALRDTGIAYPAGFSEIYPLEGSWAEVLAILRA